MSGVARIARQRSQIERKSKKLKISTVLMAKYCDYILIEKNEKRNKKILICSSKP
jgi:hypothetical protein